MTSPYAGEIRIFAFYKAPVNWLLCDGSILKINEYALLFAVIGTTYGGDGQTTFGLPDLRGRLPVGQGQGPGLTPREMGQMGGAGAVTLTKAHMPKHTHIFSVSGTEGTQNHPDPDAALAVPQSQPGGTMYAYAPADLGSPQVFADNSISTMLGDNMQHPNMMPFMALNYYIACNGIFPEKP